MIFSAIYASVASKSAAMLAGKILSIMINLDSRLSSIEKTLKRIRESSYIAGIEFLKKADNASTKKKRDELILLAANKFNDSIAENDGKLRAISYFFSGCCYELSDKNIAIYEYIYSLQAACGFDWAERSIVTNRDEVLRRIRIGSTAFGATAGAVGGTGVAALLTTNIVFFGAPIISAAALPALAIGAGAGLIIGGSPFYLASKGSEIAINLYLKKHKKELDEFFIYFTQPLASILREKVIFLNVQQFVNDISDGERPPLGILESYLGDSARWQFRPIKDIEH